jgi:Arc/MetJ-type ribon-helix-helix transcriptional regulator
MARPGPLAIQNDREESGNMMICYDESMKRTTITLPDDLAELVAREAQRRRTSVSEVIRTLLAEGLGGSDEKPREIPWAGLFSDSQMPAAEHVDEALREQWADDIDRDRR